MASAKKIFCAIPSYGGVPAQFLLSFKTLLEQAPFPTVLRILVGDSLVTRARNVLTAQFLESDCSHLFFLDSDILFTAENLRQLMSHEVEVVGGCYPLKHAGPITWCGEALRSGERPSTDGLLRVRYIGTGFLLVRREVFEKILDVDEEEIAYYTDSMPHRTEYDFWRVGVRKNEGERCYLSEDWFFCQRWLELGGDVYADTNVVLQHVGQAVYPLESQQSQLPVNARRSA